ncbi:MAG: hypothetical protein RLZZ423_1887 [Cyanobacteriota bacterium]|jgi:uncharacterized protein YbjQ (UPF0145 family)
MLLTTTPTLEGRPIRRYLGLVHGETILGANLFRDILAAIRDLIGGRARAYESTLERAREMALDELNRRALLMGADAVVGIRVDVEVLGQAGGMLMACATGTAVELESHPEAAPPPPPLPSLSPFPPGGRAAR